MIKSFMFFVSTAFIFSIMDNAVINNHLDSETNTSLTLNVKDFSATGDGKTDDSAAFNNALRELANKGGTLLVPSGKYLVGDLKIGSNTTLKGTGVPRPVLVKTPSSSTILDLTGEVVEGRRHGVHNVNIECLTLRGRSVEDGFKEHVHNIIVMGAKTLVIDNVTFEAFQGDGLYLGSRFSRTEPAVHNSEIIVSHNNFNGVNSQNRNGISIIDCEQCILEHNAFADLSRPNMPGPIDIEPNELDEIVTNIIVRNNTIGATNGVAAFSVSVRPGVFQHPPKNITVESNYIEQAKIGFRIVHSVTPGTEEQDLGIALNNNAVHATDQPLTVNGSAGIAVNNNHFSDSPASISIGCKSRADISFRGNKLERIGTTSDSGIQLCGQLRSISFNKNIFIDTGSKTQDSSAIFFSSGVMDGISFVDNTFSSPHHITRVAVRMAKTSKFGDPEPIWSGNILEDDIQRGAVP